MIQNPITFVVSNNGTILGGQRGTIRALSNYASKIYLVAPFESVSVKVNYLIYESKREVIGQYLAPTTLKGSQVLATTDPQYQTAAQWSVWEVSISQRALHRIAKYRAGRIGVSFEFTSITQPSQALSYQGLFGTDQNDVLPSVEASGNYYVCDSYNFTSNDILFTKGDYAYSNGTAWVKGQNISQVAMTTTQDLAVDPSLQAEIPEDISEDAELEALIDQLISDVGDLSTDITAHIADLNDPHDTQANQVDGTYRASATDVQSALDDIADELDAITDGDTDITYDPTADDIIDAVTVSGALGQLDDALHTHITDLTNPHQVTASQVNVSHQSQTVSVQTAINDLQADKVEKAPNTITSVSGTDKVYVNDGSEKLITVSNLKTSIVEDLVAFGYVIFTEKDGNGQPIVASPQTNKIYLFNPNDSNIPNDQYEEWVYIDSAFELIGITGIALDDYYDKTETDALLEVPLRLQLYPNTKNTSGSTIPKGAVVQYDGSQGDFIKIKQAVASEINANPSLLMGLARESIADNAFGDVVWFGNVLEIATGSFTTGQILWFDTVNGGLTATEPSDNKIQVAAVEKASSTPSSTNGILLVRIKYVSRNISDVDGLQSALDGKVNLPETEVNNGIGYWDSANNRFNTSSTLIAVDSVNGDIQGRFWRGQGVYNNLGSFNSYVNTATTGTTISRNVADANPALIVNQANASSTGDILQLQKSGTTLAFFQNNGALVAPIYIDSNNAAYYLNPASTGTSLAVAGNVGIGTTSPVRSLHINTSDSNVAYAHFTNATTGLTETDGLSVGLNATEDAIFWNRESTNVLIATNSQERLRVDSSGNVGIGNTAPTERLDVTGNIKASGTIVASGEITAPSIVIGSWRIIPDESSATLNFEVV